MSFSLPTICLSLSLLSTWWLCSFCWPASYPESVSLNELNAYNVMSWPWGAVISIYIDFSIDLYCIPLVYASWMCTDAEIATVADPGFSWGGRQLPKTYYFANFCAKNCMKMKKFGSGGCIPAAPLDPPMIFTFRICSSCFTSCLSVCSASLMLIFFLISLR